MKNRILVNHRSTHVDFKLEGCDTVFCCSGAEWDTYLAKKALIDNGASEELVNALEGAVWNESSWEKHMDEENNRDD